MNPFEPRPFSQGDLAKVIEVTRNTTIEECARVAEMWDFQSKDPVTGDSIADAIRALKDKP